METIQTVSGATAGLSDGEAQEGAESQKALSLRQPKSFKK